MAKNNNNKDMSSHRKNVFLTIVIIFFRERAAVSVAIAKMGTAIRIAIKDHYQVYDYVKKMFSNSSLILSGVNGSLAIFVSGL